VKTILVKKVISASYPKAYKKTKTLRAGSESSLIFLTTGLTWSWFRNINFIGE
jgi:hypothetical protein